MGGQRWGEADDRQSIRTIHKALELGINFFDTADVYGAGHSEELLAEALCDRRQDVVIATKVGLRRDAHGKVCNDLSAAHILKSVDASLRRLRTDVIDLYQVHWPDPKTPIEETAQALRQCQESGKVRFLGVSNFPVKLLRDYTSYIAIETLQPPLNLFERSAEVHLLPYCLEHHISVITYSPLCRGLLTGKFRPGIELKEPVRKEDPLFAGPAFKQNVELVDRLTAYAADFGRTITELAIAWVLAHKAVTTALCGARRPGHLAAHLNAVSWQLTQRDLQEIDGLMASSTRSQG